MCLQSTAFAGDNPFYLACHEKEISTQDINTGFFSNKLPRRDKENRTFTLSLLGLLIDKVQNKIKSTETLLDNIGYCFENQEDDKCAELVHWLYIEIPKFVKSARFNASLAQSPNNISTWFGNAQESINDDLSIWSIHKENNWDDLTQEESTKSKKQLSSYMQQAKTKLKEYIDNGEVKEHQYDEFLEKTLLDIRYRHYVKYQSMLGSVHLIQYLESANPSMQEIYSAFQSLRKNLELEKKYVSKKYSEYYIRMNTTMITSNSILDFFNYRSLLEDLLIENPRYCNLAAAIMKYRGRRQLKIGVSVALPIMVGSFFMPPMAGLAVGVGAGSGFVAHSQMDLNSKVQNNLGHVYGDDEGIELLEISDAKKRRDFDVVIMPIGLGVLGSGTSKIGSSVFRGTSRLAASLTKRSTNYKEILNIRKIQKKYSEKRFK
jgi:hypothetical protein